MRSSSNFSVIKKGFLLFPDVHEVIKMGFPSVFLRKESPLICGKYLC